MSEILVVIEQIALLLLVCIIGYMAGRFKYLPANSDKIISSLVVRITAPLMIFTKIYNMKFGAEDYINGIKLYFFAVFFILFAYGISLILRKTCKLRGGTARIFSLQMMFGNVLYFAIPLISVLEEQLPEIWGKGMAYAMFFILGNDTVMWTLGISLMSNKEEDNLKAKIKHLINGNTIAFFLGIILLLTGLKEVLEHVGFVSALMVKLKGIGDMTAHLSMLFIGLMLSKMNILSVFKKFKEKYIIFISSFVKLMLLPLAAILIVYLLKGFLPETPAKVLVIQLAMPGGTLIAALAAQYECDPETATQSIFISTLLLIITLPVVLWISDLVL